MRKLLVLTWFLFGTTTIFSQSVTDQEDKNLESKEQSVYSEEEKEDPAMPKSFTLDPMQEEATENAEVEEAVTPILPESTTTPTEEAVIVEQTTQNYTESEKSKDDDIQTLAGRNHHSGGFGALSFKATNFNDKNIVMAGFRAGWIINRSIAIGLDGYGVIPTAEYGGIDLLFNTRAVGGYGGLFLEPIILSNKIIHLTFPISGGAGWMGYLYDWEDIGYNYDGELVDGDVFWYIEPGAALELNVARNFRINFGASYRFTQDLQLLNTPDTAFDDWNYFLTLKFGKF